MTLPAKLSIETKASYIELYSIVNIGYYLIIQHEIKHT